jgi:peptidyl-prolyl cis-trans isomerase C
MLNSYIQHCEKKIRHLEVNFMRILTALLMLSLCAPALAQAPQPHPAKKIKPSLKKLKSKEGVSKCRMLPPQLTPGKKGSTQPEKPLPPVTGKDGMIAKVNGVGVPLALFQSKYNRFTKTFKSRKRQVPNRIAKRYRESVVKRMVEDELVNQEAKAKKITVSATDLNKEFEDYKKMFKDEKRFQRYLKTANLTVNQVKENLTKSITLKLLMKSLGVAQVSAADIKTYYEKHKSKYKVKEQVRASHILLKVKKDAKPEEIESVRKKADDLANQAKSGGDFAKLAQTHSEGPTKKRGGDLNFFTRGRMVKEFDATAFSLKVGEVSKPVKTRFGWHVIKVTDRTKAHLRKLDEVKDNIQRMLENRANRKARSNLLTQLKDKAKVEMYLP